MRYFHGTTENCLNSIEKHGLIPRGKRKGVWKEFPSATDRVYLTTAYAIYYATAAATIVKQRNGKKLRGVVIEVDPYPGNFVADEDALAQQRWMDEEFLWLNELSLEDRTAFWRNNAPDYPGMAWWSQEALGTFAHMGKIPPSQIKKVVTFDITEDHLFGHDPSITLMNYKMLGGRYEAALQLFVDSDGKDGIYPEKLGHAHEFWKEDAA